MYSCHKTDHATLIQYIKNLKLQNQDKIEMMNTA